MLDPFFSTLDPIYKHTRESESPRTTVGLQLQSPSSSSTPIYFELPLGEKVFQEDFPMLPLRPGHAQIVNMTTRTVGNGSETLGMDRLRNVLCLAYPKANIDSRPDDIEDRPMAPEDATYPVWWTLQDGLVDFEDPLARWYLAGWDVEAYECI